MSTDILLVDDDPWMIQMLGSVLGGTGQLRFATCGEAALRLARDFPPDLMLLDARMPEMDGYQVCREMKADPLLADIPIIFVTGDDGPEFELEALALGAADFIAKPFSPSLLMARVVNQLRAKRAADELRSIATIDFLTGLVNRRAFDETIAREARRHLRADRPMSLLIVDVDHFKLFNDRYGHPAGDECLRRVARALRESALRGGDVVARLGGEEFAVLMPGTSFEGAQHAARRVLGAVAGLGIGHETSPTAGHVTVSIGLSCMGAVQTIDTGPEVDSNAEQARTIVADLLSRADRALYAAKRGGRAQIWAIGSGEKDLPVQVEHSGVDLCG